MAGAPKIYDRAAVVALICERLAKGDPMSVICRDDGMPCVASVQDWAKEDESIATNIARARARGFDAIAESCFDIADEPPPTNSFGNIDAGAVQHAKLRIWTRLQLLAKWDPKRYGDKLAIGGAEDLPAIKTMTDAQLDARIAALQAKLNGNKG